MSKDNSGAPQGTNGGMENTPTNPGVSMLQQFEAIPMSQRPDEKMTADKVKALANLVGPLDEAVTLEAQRAEHEANQKLKASIIPTIIGGIMAASSLILVPMGEEAAANLGESCGIIFGGFLILLVGGGALAIKSLSNYIKKTSRRKKAERELPRIYDRLIQLKTSVDWQPIAIIPPGYRNVDALSFICVAFINGRATTIQEAVNLYEQELYNLKMQRMAAATLRAAEEARVAANKAAVSSAISAGFSMLDFFFG